MTFKGRAARQGEIPVGLADALAYFSDVKAFIQKIEDVKEVRDLALPKAYLMSHHPIGALNYYVTVVTAVQAEPTPSGLRLTGLDFDETKLSSEHQLLKGFIDGALEAREIASGRTALDFFFDISFDFTVQGPLVLVPRPVIQSTADSLLRLKLGVLVENLYQKVVEDFRLSA
ncbi:MAG: DUF1997 domain-containing protein [Candidatus Sericytochromatia bacterium]|nr:DUF1997 domain-containing protein [Candidatus Sericytochromatia bacterium]